LSYVPVGASTKAALYLIVGAVAAFVVAWVETGSAPAWLAGIAAGLTALLGVLRSWQAVTMTKAGDAAPSSDLLVDEAPVIADDYPEAA
jgi:hypothetical protein